MKTFFVAFGLLCSISIHAVPGINIIPKPVKMRVTTGLFILGPGTTVTMDKGFNNDALGRLLRIYLCPATGYRLQSSSVDSRGIVFKKIALPSEFGDEGYRLSVTPKRVLIEASKAAGAFYGIQTVRQLLPTQIFAGKKQSGISWTIPCVEITDYPRFEWRGLHIDVSRHFFGPKYVKRFIDLLALHKLNTFHWHLCDDDGWRIEIKKYPLLTEKGSSRSRTINYGKPMFYTQDEIRRIVSYAAERHVNIVPEIEIPGHEQSAINVYPEFGARNDKGQLGNVFNIRDKTVQALKEILSEVVDLFPSPYVHCGGDEVWASWVWKKDAESAAKAKRLGLHGAHQIQTWLMNEMGTFLASRGRRMVGWGEIAGDKLSKNTIVMAWRGDGKTGILSAKKGFDVVMAPGAYTYFDHRQAPNEKGFGGSVLTLSRVYSFDPVFPGQLTSAQAHHILGCQGQLWTEMIPVDARMDYMAYPRGCALAEVGWTPQADRSFDNFKKRLRVHLSRLDELKVNYRIPSQVVIEEKDGKYYISLSGGTGIVHYTTDGTYPNEKSPVYSAPVRADDIQVIQALVILKDGRKGTVTRYVGITTPPLKADTCKIDGGMHLEALKPGRKSIGGWGNPKGKLRWRIRVEKAGRYTLSGLFSNSAPAEMKLKVGDKSVLFTIPKLKGWYEPVKVDIGLVEIPAPGVYTVILSVANPKGYKGINMWEIYFNLKS